MAFTQLNPSALPGKPYSFSPKAEAIPESGPHTGLFTELSNIALPGQRHSFTAKTAAEIVPGIGGFSFLRLLLEEDEEKVTVVWH